MTATIETQGSQHIVKEGDILTVNRYVDSKTGDSIKIETVLTLGEGEKMKVGAPFVKGASVTATVLENKRGDKVVSIRKRKRQRTATRRGHRQQLSVIKIESIKG